MFELSRRVMARCALGHSEVLVFNKEPKSGRWVNTRNNPLDWFTQYLIVDLIENIPLNIAGRYELSCTIIISRGQGV